MSNHLSQDQFAKCLIGRPASAELQHIMECAECSAELDRFGNTMSSFRNAIRERIDDRVTGMPGVPPFSMRPAAAGIPMWRWALVAAGAVVLAIVPFITKEKEPQIVIEEESPPQTPDAVMNAVNLHLSRTIPAPMERIMTVIPNDESIEQSGGVQ